jgi:hypothetical protein
MYTYKFAANGTTYTITAKNFVEAALEVQQKFTLDGPWSWRLDENGVHRITYD